MSSATSIKGAAGSGSRKLGADASARTSDASQHGFRPWHFFVLASLLGSTVAVVMARQPTPEHLVLLSFTVAAAGVCAAALYATLAPLVRRDTDTVRALRSDRARAALEREKMLVLRSIKELEFDRAMGKVSAGDFDEMTARLRARALALMKQLDAGTPVYRTEIERDLAARLEKQAAASGRTCRCGTSNDADAAFCKRCGARLQPDRGARVGPREH
jgi:hypothetical protein